jgi:hypothetical protein
MENRVVFCLFAITSWCNSDNAKTHHPPDGIWGAYATIKIVKRTHPIFAVVAKVRFTLSFLV